MRILLGGINQLTDHGQYFVGWQEEFQSSPYQIEMHSLPIGLLYIASAQRKFGRTDCEYELFDFNMLGETDNEVLFAEYERRLTAFQPDLVALGCLTHRQIVHLERAIQIARRYAGTREGGAFVVTGGMPATAQPGRFIEAGADAVCIGEGEMTFSELVDRVAEGGPLEDIQGLALPRELSDGEIPLTPLATSAEMATADPTVLRTPPRAQVKDLDDLPMPAWDLADVAKLVKKSGGVYSPMITQRGCPYECFYCDHDRIFRSHSAKRVVDEIEHLQTEYGAKRVDIVDEIFNCSKPRILAIRDEKVRRGIRCQLQDYDGLRADILDEETVDALVEMGLVACSVAIEVGTMRMQRMIKKRLKIDKALQAATWLADRRVFVNAFFMIGFPGEERHEMESTLRVAQECAAHQVTLSKVEIYPGTAMWDFAIEQGVDPDIGYGSSKRFGEREDVGATTIPEDELHALWRRGLWDIYNQRERLGRIEGLFGPRFLKQTYQRFYERTQVWSEDFAAIFEECFAERDFERLLGVAQEQFFAANPEVATALDTTAS